MPALLLGLICALVSILFCEVMHASRRLFGRWFPNRYVRVAVGAVLVVGASLLLGTGRYNGHGIFEYACQQEMQSMVEVLIKIVTAE